MTNTDLSGKNACEITPLGVFVAQGCGYCLKISVPAKTDNEWASPNRFIDLPMMDKETFENFIEALNKFRVMYD